MRVLFIGGTGLISSACAQSAISRGIALTLLNRGVSRKYSAPAGAELLTADIHGDPAALSAALGARRFDAVVDWIAFDPADVERDIRLFLGKTGQFVFISSASAYQKPPRRFPITEDTPLENPYWEYSRKKIACEERLLRAWREDGFPVTIVRPSHTYGPSQIPLCLSSWQHPYTVIKRMLEGKKIIVPGDGTSMWTLTWNEDFAKGFVGLLGLPKAVGQAFHITSDEALTWNAIYRETGRAAGVEPDLIHIPSDLIAAYDPELLGTLVGDKANNAVFDNAKIKRYVPEFSATVSWPEGVRRALAWHQADAARRTIDPEADALWDRITAGYMRAFPR